MTCRWSGRRGASTGWAESSGFLPCVDVPFTSDALGGERAFSPSTENRLLPVAGASGFPEVDVWLVPRLDSVEEVDFENATFFFFDANEGVTHSLELFFDAIMIECEEYRIVDAIVNRVLPREVAQAVMVPTTLVSRSLVRDVGKDLPRDEPVVCVCSFGASEHKARLETFPACICSGDTFRDNDCTDVLSTHEQLLTSTPNSKKNGRLSKHTVSNHSDSIFSPGIFFLLSCFVLPLLLLPPTL